MEKAIADITGGTAHVFGLPHPTRGQQVAAVLTLDEPGMFDETALRESPRTRLSAYKIPGRFAAITTSDIPLLPSGKVDLRELQKIFDARHRHLGSA